MADGLNEEATQVKLIQADWAAKTSISDYNKDSVL